MALVSLEVRYVARLADGSEWNIGSTWFAKTCDLLAAPKEVTLFAGAIEMASSNLGESHHSISHGTPEQGWMRNWERRGRILFAHYIELKRKEGLLIHPQNLRTEAGRLSKDLNDQYPGLNTTLDEIIEIFGETAETLFEETFHKKRQKSTK